MQGQSETGAVGTYRSIIPQGPARDEIPGQRLQPGETAVSITDRHRPARPTPPPMPNGWFALASSIDVQPGAIYPVIACGRELLVYRTESGESRVIDAHCPHLGAHLGGGIVVGETIKCPYHGWQYGDDGRCVEIPYSEGRIPAKARVPSYPVDEKNGFIHFWFHAGGKPPAYDIPDVPATHGSEFTEPRIWTYEIEAAMQEMAENNVDYAHLRYVHRRPTVPGDTSEFFADGHYSRVIEQLDEGQTFTRHAYGPGVSVLEVPELMTVVACATPISRTASRLRWHFHVPVELAGSIDAVVDGVTGEYGFAADVPIFVNKIYLERPVLVKDDGPFVAFRAWYAQFYEDADAG